jgi:hypothetical protein
VVGNCPSYDVVHLYAPLVRALLATNGSASGRASAGLGCHCRHVTQATGVMLRRIMSICQCGMAMHACIHMTASSTRLGDAVLSALH